MGLVLATEREFTPPHRAAAASSRWERLRLVLRSIAPAVTGAVHSLLDRR